MKNQNTGTINTMRIAGSLSLIALPLLLAAVFVLHFTSLSDFLSFKFSKPPYSAERLLQTLTGPDGGFRFYTLPHLIGYLALPLFISTSLTLAQATFRQTPWHAVIGAALTCFGVIFLGGVFGAWFLDNILYRNIRHLRLNQNGIFLVRSKKCVFGRNYR